MSDVPFQDTTASTRVTRFRGKLSSARRCPPQHGARRHCGGHHRKRSHRELDTRAAAAVSGVRLVLTHRDLGDVKSAVS